MSLDTRFAHRLAVTTQRWRGAGAEPNLAGTCDFRPSPGNRQVQADEYEDRQDDPDHETDYGGPDREPGAELRGGPKRDVDFSSMKRSRSR
jgi:hypothetical protein